MSSGCATYLIVADIQQHIVQQMLMIHNVNVMYLP